jgi:hypothetical protein
MILRTNARRLHEKSRLRHLVTATSPKWPFRLPDQRVVPSRHLVTQRPLVAPCANSQGGATATPGPGRRSQARGSSLGSQAWRASAPGWRPCWPLCRPPPSSKRGHHTICSKSYAKRDELVLGLAGGGDRRGEPVDGSWGLPPCGAALTHVVARFVSAPNREITALRER